MPEATIASVVSRTTFSFTSQANLFQLFQPIGGVKASPFGALLITSCVVSATAGAVTSTSANKTAHKCAMRARIDFEPVGDAVCVECLVQFLRIEAKPVLIADVDRDRSIAA